MQAAFYEWMRILLVGTVCIQLILQFIGDEAYRRYIRLFLSLIFLLCVFRPLLSVTGVAGHMAEQVEDWLAGWEYRDLADAGLYEADGTDTLMEQAVRKKLTEDTTRLLAKEHLTLVSLDCQLVLDGQEAKLNRLTVVADTVEGKEKLSFREREERELTVRRRLGERYELSESRIDFRIRR